MKSTEIKRNLMQHLTLRNLEAYAQETDKAVFIADLIGESIDHWTTAWLDSQFYNWATELELI